MIKVIKKIRSLCLYIIHSLTPVSTKNLYIAEIIELYFKSNYITINYTAKEIGYTIVRRKEAKDIYIDVFTKSIYENKNDIVFHTYNGSQVTVDHLILLPTLKRFISKKSLIYLFNEYIKKREDWIKNDL